MKIALEQKKPLIESKFYYDEEYDKRSISAYYPMVDEQGNYLAMVGVDCFQESYLDSIVMYRVIPIFPAISLAVILFFIPLMLIKVVKLKFYF